MAFLKVFERGEERTVFLGSEPIVIGRGAGVELFIKDKKASRHHCIVEPHGDGWRVRDLGSGNGTRVNEVPIEERVLSPDDVIQVGAVRFLFAGEAVKIVSEAPERELLDTATEPKAIRAPKTTRRERVARTDEPAGEPRAPREPGARRARKKSKAPWVIGVICLIGAAGVFSMLQGEQEQKDIVAAEKRAYRKFLRAGSDRTRLAAARVYLKKYPLGAHADHVREQQASVNERLNESTSHAGQRSALDAQLADLDVDAALAKLREMLESAPEAERGAIQTAIAEREEARRRARTEQFGALEAEFDRLVRERRYGEAKEIWFFLGGDWGAIDQEFILRIVAANGRMDTSAVAERGELFENVNRAESAHDFDRAIKIIKDSAPRFRGTSVSESLAEKIAYLQRAKEQGVTGAPTAAPTAVSIDIEREVLRILQRVGRREFAEAAADLKEILAKIQAQDAKREIQARIDECEAAVALIRGTGNALVAGRVPKKTLKYEKDRWKILSGNREGVTVKSRSRQQKLTWAQTPSALFVLLLEGEIHSTPKGPLGLAVASHATGRQDLWLYGLASAYQVAGKDRAAIDLFVATRIRNEKIPQGGYVVYKGELLSKREQVRRVEEETIANFTAVMTTSAEKIRTHKVFRRLDKLEERKDKLDEARDFAKLLIYDEKKYFYPYRNTGREGEYSKVQKEVDGRVDGVVKLWNDKSSITIKATDDMKRALAKFDESVAELERRLVDVSDLKDEIAWLRSYLGKRFDVRTFYRTARELDLLEYTTEVMEDNTRVVGDITEIEREQVRITNLYRIMFGHWPVRIVEPLVLSSRGHCEEMSRIGYFSHFSPTAGRRTPGERMRLAGYKYGISENIIMGRSDPKSAHAGWCHSSGHHRNLLMAAWTEMGTGHYGRYMCQNFGQAPRFSKRWKRDAVEYTDDDEDDDGLLPGEDLEYDDDEGEDGCSPDDAGDEDGCGCGGE
ncbi:MAG: FHA domain-containing protein [Planctomycetota bacterium]